MADGNLMGPSEAELMREALVALLDAADDTIASGVPAAHLDTAAAHARRALAVREPPGKWKCGNEYAPYHPAASHVPPDYRDGWNACYRAAETQDERKRFEQWFRDYWARFYV